MPTIDQIQKLPSILSPRVFVLGDSFSTIRRKIDGTTPESAANLNINGRFTSASGLNLWDYFRIGFDSVYSMTLTTNYAREGAMAVNDWRTTASWSDINPIPSVGSQMTSLIAANASSTITDRDVLGILIGTNDKVSNTGSTTAADGGTKPTAQATSDAIVSVVNRAITHGFKNIIVMHPEGKWFSTVSPILFPALNTIQSSNRSVKLLQCYANTAILEFASPYHPDALHPNDTSHKRLGEVLTDTFQQNQVIDKTQSFLISTKGSSASNPREIGFNNFDPTVTTGNYVRVKVVDQFNCFESHTNKGMTIRAYNGLNVCAAFEGNDPTSRMPAGGGKSDACLTVWGNFWEHKSLLLLDNVASSPAPAILSRRGGVDNFKINATGSGIIDTSDTNTFEFISRPANAIGRVVADAKDNGATKSNVGFELRNNGVATWALCSYFVSGTRNSFTFYNTQTGATRDSLFIQGDSNNVGISTSNPVHKLDVGGAASTIGINGVRVLVNPQNNTGNLTGWNVGTAGVSGSVSSTTLAGIKGYAGTANISSLTTTSVNAALNHYGARINALITALRTHGILGD
jgi:hypothetical protein